jgi:diaminohydroxyphosphoribosylaminopyrimidine deaminase/5-amino-6-(5-phosphoribosylamino)uracil reductase
MNAAMTADDQQWMRNAIALARPQVGRTGGNPAVGCVIVNDGEMVGRGATADGGRPHAEELALAQAGERARGAVAYVTLEPCGERSSGAASCSQRLVSAGVSRVVIAADDASIHASGQGLERLRAAGIDVRTGVLAEEAQTALYGDYRPRRPIRGK